MNLDFLRSVPVAAAVKAERASQGPTLVKTPVEGADLRLFRNGRLYPSEAFAEKYSLNFYQLEEYVNPANSEEMITRVRGNGLDMFTSDDWSGIDLETNVLFVGITPREGNLKLDAFGGTSYDKETGAPKTTIYDMGKQTAIAERVVPLMPELFEVHWEENRYVDLKIRTDIPIVSPNGVYHLPKVVQRGEDRGKPTYVRREEIEVFPVEIFGEYVRISDVAEDVAAKHDEAEVLNQEHEQAPTAQTMELTPEQTVEDKAQELRNSFA